MTTARRRILIVLHEPGYFRFYGAVIAELGRQGWDVQLAFDRPDKRGTPQVPAGAGPEVHSIGAVPEVPVRGITRLRPALDYVRYLDPPFREAHYLRRRAEKHLPPQASWLTRLPPLPRGVVTAGIGLSRLVERVTPPAPVITAWLRQVAPDVVFVSPLVTPGPSSERQTDVVKAARALRLPVIVGVASWDHLTSKGLVRVEPDALLVWNETQVDEAVTLHRLARARVIVTGAQSLDHWFTPEDTRDADRLRAALGIEPDRAVVLFVGSSRNMAPGRSEPAFVSRWMAALRASPDPLVRGAFVVVRPHPTNAEPWAGADLGPGAVVFPTTVSGIPLTDSEVDDFRHSLRLSRAVVGVNTTAMIEAAILRRPVLSVRDDAFTHSQAETLHFAHLAEAVATTARTLDEHVAQLSAVLRDPAPALDAGLRFGERFVRPLGLDEPARLHVCRAIDRVAARSGVL